MKTFLTLLAVVAIQGTALIAQETERILIPIAIGDTPGGYGSIWRSELWARNGSAATVMFDANEPCVTLCPPFVLYAGEDREVRFAEQPAGLPGYILYAGPDVSLNLRVQDLSRQALTWGTEIPVVRETTFTDKTIHLLNIPLDQRFRQMLRLYALDGPAAATVTIRDIGTNVVLATKELTLTANDQLEDAHQVQYAQLGDLATEFPAIAGEERVTIEVASKEGARLWAFISITNNETQHVTTITPQ